MSRKRDDSAVAEDAFKAIVAIRDSLTKEQQFNLDCRMVFNGNALYGEFVHALMRQDAKTERELRQLQVVHRRRSRPPDEELNREVVRLRDEENKTGGDLAEYIAKVTRKPCTYNAAMKRYYKAKAKPG